LQTIYINPPQVGASGRRALQDKDGQTNLSAVSAALAGPVGLIPLVSLTIE